MSFLGKRANPSAPNAYGGANIYDVDTWWKYKAEGSVDINNHDLLNVENLNVSGTVNVTGSIILNGVPIEGGNITNLEVENLTVSTSAEIAKLTIGQNAETTNYQLVPLVLINPQPARDENGNEINIQFDLKMSNLNTEEQIAGVIGFRDQDGSDNNLKGQFYIDINNGNSTTQSVQRALSLDFVEGMNINTDVSIQGDLTVGQLNYATLNPPISGGVSQNLQQVLSQGNDAGGLSIINLSELTVETLNYTNLNPSINTNLNIEDVLENGGNANNQSIYGLQEVGVRGPYINMTLGNALFAEGTGSGQYIGGYIPLSIPAINDALEASDTRILTYGQVYLKPNVTYSLSLTNSSQTADYYCRISTPGDYYISIQNASPTSAPLHLYLPAVGTDYYGTRVFIFNGAIVSSSDLIVHPFDESANRFIANGSTRSIISLSWNRWGYFTLVPRFSEYVWLYQADTITPPLGTTYEAADGKIFKLTKSGSDNIEMEYVVDLSETQNGLIDAKLHIHNSDRSMILICHILSCYQFEDDEITILDDNPQANIIKKIGSPNWNIEIFSDSNKWAIRILNPDEDSISAKLVLEDTFH